MIDETLAPGCFGSALTFELGSAECSQCMFAAQCGPKSAQRMEYLRAKFKVPARRTIKTTSPVARPGSAELSTPKPVTEMLDRIERAGIKVTEALRQRKNPFESGFLALKIACHVLLHMPEGVDQDRLKTALSKAYGGKDATAAAHAALAKQVLVALGAAIEMNGKLRLK